MKKINQFLTFETENFNITEINLFIYFLFIYCNFSTFKEWINTLFSFFLYAFIETIETMKDDKNKCMLLTHNNLQMLTEMFCLPYTHGNKGNTLLADFEWLLENTADIYEAPPSKEKVKVISLSFSLFSDMPSFLSFFF